MKDCETLPIDSPVNSGIARRLLNAARISVDYFLNKLGISPEDSRDRESMACFAIDYFLNKSRENPLWLTRECTAGWCPLNRLSYPKTRDWIERFIVSDIIERYPDKNQPLTVSFYYPAAFLSELIVATRLLESGYHNLTINIVGMANGEPFLEHLRKLNGVIPVERLDPKGGIIPVKLQDPKEHEKTWLNYSTYQLAQIVHWLHACSTGDVRIGFYASDDEYLEDCKVNPAFSSDVCIGIDIFQGMDEVDYLWPIDFHKMNLIALKKGGVAYTCSRAALTECHPGTNPLTHALDEFDKTAPRPYPSNLEPPIEVITKVVGMSWDEFKEIDSMVKHNWKESPELALGTIQERIKRNATVDHYYHSNRHKQISFCLGRSFAFALAGLRPPECFVRK